jgi:hypothetical protein
MKSRTIVIALVAALAVSAIAFLGSGDGLGSSIGSIGQKAVDGAIGMFVYKNHSGDSSPAAQPIDHAARVNAARARSAQSADAMNGGAQGDGAYGSDVIDAATEAAQLAGEGSMGIADRAGQPVDGMAAASDPNASASGSADAAVSDPNAINPAGAVDVALGEPVVLETEGGESVSAPSSTNEMLPGGQPPAEGAASGVSEGSIAPSSEEGWSNSDPFEFEDESVLREMGPGYSRFDGRDPFLALITANNQGAASATVDPDGMRFVGIIWGARGIRALVEDSLRRGYVLREGDRVLYGRVTSISRDRIVVDQVIHGEFKRVTLRLEPYSREGN